MAAIIGHIIANVPTEDPVVSEVVAQDDGAQDPIAKEPWRIRIVRIDRLAKQGARSGKEPADKPIVKANCKRDSVDASKCVACPGRPPKMCSLGACSANNAPTRITGT